MDRSSEEYFIGNTAIALEKAAIKKAAMTTAAFSYFKINVPQIEPEGSFLRS